MTKIYQKLLILVQILFIIDITITQDTCYDPLRRRGICIGIRSCKDIANMLRGKIETSQRIFLKESQCGWDGNYPKVCCANQISNVPTVRRPSPGFTNSIQFPGDQYISDRRPSLTSSSLLPKIGQCGIQIYNKIFGGSIVRLDEFPWMALLEYAKPDGTRGVHCGGTLINDRYIVTAAHCIPSNANTNFRLKSARLGEYNINTDPDCDPQHRSDCADPVQNIPIEREIPHEGYNLQTLRNDIALLRLARKAKFNYYVKPICLPIDANLQDDTITVGQKFDVAGWGRTEWGYKSPVKLKVRVEGKSNAYCSSVYAASATSKSIFPEQLCAGGEPNKDSCNGDSGGGLMGFYKDSQGNAYWYLAGIVSFGPQECGLKDWPGVYTRVNKYISWIQTKLQP